MRSLLASGIACSGSAGDTGSGAAGTSSSRRCLLAGGLRSLSRLWQNHICSCLSDRPIFTDSSARIASDGYCSAAPTETKNRNQILTKNSIKNNPV
jgi:hypothetical protein